MRRIIISNIPEDFDIDKDILLSPSSLAGQENSYSGWSSYLIEPDPFETVSHKQNAAEYTARYANHLLPYVTEHLNKLNNVHHSIKFWRILIFPWLIVYIQVLWERYLRTKNIIQKYADEKIEIELISNKYRWKFHNTLEFYYDGALNIHYHDWLLSRLLEKNKPHNWSFKFVDKKPLRQTLPSKSWKNKIFDQYFTTLRFNNVIGLNFIELLTLSMVLSFKKGDRAPSPTERLCDVDKTFDYDEYFNKIILPNIFNEMPECFKNIHLLKHPNPVPQKRKIRIPSAYGLYFNENYKKYLAHCVAEGEKIISTQHGGYGSALFFSLPAEVEYAHETFITWGWTRHGDYQSNFVDLPSPYLSKIADGHKARNNNLIFVGTIINLVPYGIESTPQPLQQLTYIKEKFLFLKNLEESIFNNLLYRPYYRNHGTLEENELVEYSFPSIKFCRGNLHSQIFECKLLILDHPGTTLNIALAANIPTICYWDEKLFPSCKQISPIFEHFKQTGILFNKALDAASKVNEIWADVDSWWQQKEIQDARQNFCWNYARTHKFWLIPWMKALWKL